jgi:hypothetical protein
MKQSPSFETTIFKLMKKVLILSGNFRKEFNRRKLLNNKRPPKQNCKWTPKGMLNPNVSRIYLSPNNKNSGSKRCKRPIRITFLKPEKVNSSSSQHARLMESIQSNNAIIQGE